MKLNNKILMISITVFGLCFLGGCASTPPTKDHNPQPWAQMEDWQANPTLPGFGQSDY